MNDSLDQHSAQTPSPSTGSRQATQSVGSAMSSATFEASAHAPRQAASAARARLPIEREEAISASMRGRLTRRALDCQRPYANVSTGMVQNPSAAPVLFDRVAEDLGDRLQAVTRQFADVADIWSPGGLRLADRFKAVEPIELASDIETLALQTESVDLVVSALALQFVNDLPGVLMQMRRSLRPDGLLLAAMIGGDTLTELRQSFAAAEAERE